MIKRRTLIFAAISMLLGLPSTQAQKILTIDGNQNVNSTFCQVTIPDNMQLTTVGNQKVLSYSNIKKAENTQNVKFTLKGNSKDGYTPSEGKLFNKKEFKTLRFKKGSIETSDSITAGIYDGYVYFKDQLNQMHIVFKENINVGEDAVIEFDCEEAVNGITYKFYDENSVELCSDRYNINNVVEKEGTVKKFNNDIVICHKDYGVQLIILSGGRNIIDHEEAFFINTPSNKYYIGSAACLTKPDYTKYIIKSLITEFKTQTFSNNPSDLLYREASIINTPVAKDDSNSHFPITSFTIIAGNTKALSSDTQHSKDIGEEFRTMKFWLDTPTSNMDDEIEFDVVFTPKYNDYLVSNNWGGTNKFAVKAPGYIGNKTTGVKLYNFGSDERAGFNKSLEYKDGKLFPSHPDFSFDTEESMTFGNSAPLCSFMASFYRKDNTIDGFMKALYLGRYGETYDSSTEIVKSASTQESIGDGMTEIYVPNYNIEVDGMEGENITRVVFNGNKEDFIAPTMQMLSVIDKDGNVQDHLDCVDGSKLIMAGGDFDYHRENKWGYFTCKDAAIEVYYTINGYEDNWQQLEAKEIPEKFFMPAYGNFYEVQLNGIEIPEPDTWIDLKLVLTDETGNYQEQIIRPVIHIDNISTGIKHAKKDVSNILIFDSKIRLSGNVTGQIDIYSIDGKKVLSTFGSEINTESLTPGSYIVKVCSENKSYNNKFVKF